MSLTVRTAADAYLDGSVVTLTLAGEADNASGPLLEESITRILHEHGDLAELRLDLTELTHMSSAGVRSLVVAHQRLGRVVDIVFTGVHPEVAESIRLTSFDRSAVLQEAGCRRCGQAAPHGEP